MSFDFRLDRVMRIAESERKNFESQYQVLYDRLEKIAHQLLALMEEKKRTQSDLEKKMRKAMTIDSMRLQLIDVETTDRMIDEQTLIYNRSKRQLEQLRVKLHEKTIEVKKYENMREKKKEVYNQEVKKDEMKLMDEVAALRAVSHG
ncbi:flagellar export protein FliJ [Sporolactobacillus shoreae]|uniref:Flagellar FliJ protein n=1 Tax=Sporolactobacillus shoreae TaxID=1465501 RepID=A0A4Z0GVE6_9BACL|nr:flagellar export protein FliJ [Sporolactobacillus shoreae]TGB00282.1 flagellar export protein FliJ [Sporolactobacillus shoreae]